MPGRGVADRQESRRSWPHSPLRSQPGARFRDRQQRVAQRRVLLYSPALHQRKGYSIPRTPKRFLHNCTMRA